MFPWQRKKSDLIEKAALFPGGVCSPQLSLAVELSGELGRYGHTQRLVTCMLDLPVHHQFFLESGQQLLLLLFPGCLTSCPCWTLWASPSAMFFSSSCLALALFSMASWKCSWYLQIFLSFLGTKDSWQTIVFGGALKQVASFCWLSSSFSWCFQVCTFTPPHCQSPSRKAQSALHSSPSSLAG